MQQPNRAGQYDLVGLDHDGFAFHAAQVIGHVGGRILAHREAAAIDHDAIEIARIAGAVEPDLGAMGAKLRVQRRQHAARLDMTLIGKVQRVPKTPCERRFKFPNAIVVDVFGMPGHAREAFEIGAVARVGDHQGTAEFSVGNVVAPQRQRACSKAGDDRLGRFLLAPWRQHAAGVLAGGLRKIGIAAFVDRDLMPGLREQQSLPSSGHTGANDADGRRQ